MNRRGSILIVVLFVLSVLSLATLSLAYRTSLEGRTIRHRAAMSQLRAQVRSAAAIALARLAANTNDFDHLAEPWCADTRLDDEDWLPEWAPSTDDQPAFKVEYRAIDEERKANITFLGTEAMEALGTPVAQIEGLMDWMDADDSVHAEGAEVPYYLSLPSPHRCKNAPLELVEEMLMIRGFSWRDLYDSAGDASGIGGQRHSGWIDLLRAGGGAKLNINTAPREVLELLPLSDGAVDQILAFRRFDEFTTGEIEDFAFRGPQDIEQLQGLTEADVAVLKQTAVFRSEHFRITVNATHRPTGLRYRLEILAKMANGKPEILQWKVGI